VGRSSTTKVVIKIEKQTEINNQKEKENKKYGYKQE
jgi:hypothetical protein